MKLVSVLLVLAVAIVADAQSCRTVAPVRRAAVVVQEAVVVQQVIVPVLTPFPLVVDNRIAYLYGGGTPNYTAPAAAAMPAMPKAMPKKSSLSNDQLDLLLDALEARLRERNAKPSAKGPPPVPIPVARLGVADVMLTHCAECHTSGRTKGNDFAMFDTGNLLRVDFGKVYNAIAGGSMPPANRPRLSAADLAIVETLRTGDAG